MVSSGSVFGRTVLNSEDQDEKDGVCLFGNSTSVAICYTFLDIILHSCYHDILVGNIMQFARIDAWVATVLTSLEHKKASRVYTEKCMQTISQVMSARDSTSSLDWLVLFCGLVNLKGWNCHRQLANVVERRQKSSTVYVRRGDMGNLI